MTARFGITVFFILATITTISHAKAIVEENGKQTFLQQITGRSSFDRYTLGQEVDGARILYSYQYEQSFDSVQPEISLDYDYPSADVPVNNNVIVTQIVLYVEASDDATTQAYTTNGGIGQSSISLQIVAKNSTYLRYMVVVYGRSV
ncbi:uncharacterized protein LOC101900839 [Musca domestica]|uniref:Uncharacterized protein LOC101900839 n=1 Tax=Musca domestica TaxID=7370 RepID=A0A9J7CPR9_MUSDO|nr:uncharacterized protein LOC101900839 [Musca domestica]